MGLAFTRLTLSNPSRPDLAPICVDGRVDTASPHLRVPRRLAAALDLIAIDHRRVMLPDGSVGPAPYVGVLRLDLAGRVGLSGALIVGDHVELGSIVMDDMDLVLDPATGEVAANPLHPDIAATVAVGVRAAF